MPIAKDSIFNSINDGVIVLDQSHRIIEFNESSKRMFPSLSKFMIGQDFHRVWIFLSGDSFPANLNADSPNHELQYTSVHSKRIYQIRTSALQDGKSSNGLLIIFTDITELKMLQMKLEHQAYYDELTNVFNRRAFFQKCEQDFAVAKKRSSPFTIILIDIDYFKKVNDTYGHHVGDQVLKHVVNVCESHLKEGMLFARYGGEEFVLALKGWTISEGEALANQLRRQVEAQPLITNEGTIFVTLSSGVAETTKEKEESLHQLLNKADQALYKAKRAGRNQVHIWDKGTGTLSRPYAKSR